MEDSEEKKEEDEKRRTAEGHMKNEERVRAR
jgi:hypothetical protein